MKHQSKKKILISIIGFAQGGAEIMPIRIANVLYEKGYGVALHCVSNDVDQKIKAMLNPKIPVYYTDKFWRMGWIILYHHFKIVNTHSVPSQMLLARTIKRLPFLKFKHVATSHGGYEGMESHEALKRIKEIDPYVNCWTFVADNNRLIFQKAGISASKLNKISNAMVVPTTITPVCLQDYGIAKNAYVFCTISRAVDKKSWKECIEAIKQARALSNMDIHLVLAGTGPVYDALIKERQEGFIHLIGAVDSPCDYYKASYCGLLLSVLECAPLGIIEMYQAGIPVVATATGDVAEMMQYNNQSTGLLIPLDKNGKVPINQAAEAICRMVQDQKLYKECRNNAAHKASDFDMNHVVRQYLKCFNNKKDGM
jgi:glycosyltransferase involved in cell wall biosynthesis